MGKVIAVCTSERKGLQKSDVKSAHFTTEWGIDGDAHAGKWHRQISLLSADKIAAFNEREQTLSPARLAKTSWSRALIFARCLSELCSDAATCCSR